MKKNTDLGCHAAFGRFRTAALLLLLVASCGTPREKTPAGLVTEEEMVELLVGFHLARARMQAESFADYGERNKEAYYVEVLKERQVTYPRFKASMDYYARHPRRLTIIYDKVIEELSKRQAEETAG